jgi:hypothetical protein
MASHPALLERRNEIEIDAPLKRVLAASLTQSAAGFHKKFESRIAAGVIFVGFDNGKPAVADLTFLIEDLAAGEIKLQIRAHYCPSEEYASGYAFYVEPLNLPRNLPRRIAAIGMDPSARSRARRRRF